MNYSVGDILFFRKYLFTDTGEEKKHYALVLLPPGATKYSSNVYCCVITSRKPRGWYLELDANRYTCFSKTSYCAFDRRDLTPGSGIGAAPQPRAVLTKTDLKRGFKILKAHMFSIDDKYLRATIIYQWKKSLGLLK
jgi:hypothetical protein